MNKLYKKAMEIAAYITATLAIGAVISALVAIIVTAVRVVF